MKAMESSFKDYLTKNYPEHGKRILKAHARAWFSRIFFPMFFFLIPALFFVAAGVLLYYFKQPSTFSLPEQERYIDFLKEINLRNGLISIFMLGIILSLAGFFIGLMLGFARAKVLLFEAEKLELCTKQLWLSERESES